MKRNRMIELDDDQLQGLAQRDLRTTIELWLRSVEAIRLGPHSLSGAGSAYDAWLEVFRLQSRILTEFFRSRPDKDDVVARHFVPDWPARVEVDLKALLVASERTRQRPGHLTVRWLYDPAAARDLERWARVIPHLLTVWLGFLESLPPERRSWFDWASQR
jgi:hypothetical protein